MEEQGFVVRRPRYEVRPDAECTIVLTVIGKEQPCKGQLADLSRNGLKVISNRQFPIETSLRVYAELPNGLTQIADPATVRWCRQQDDGTWATGLHFEADLSWEIMGEMFLNDILALEPIYAESA